MAHCLRLLLLVVLVACCYGHIHSQKIRSYSEENVSPITWLLALVSAALVGACGVLPLLLNRWVRLESADGSNAAMRAVLAFAVGGLLGDVFLHLLPESWGSNRAVPQVRQAGLWLLAGFIAFLTVEKIGQATAVEKIGQAMAQDCVPSASTGAVANGGIITDGPLRSEHNSRKDVRGYLNLAANCTDNFTHGLAIAASYIASPMVGLLTTVAIICHEVPHEIGDFAILLRSGFESGSAAKAQVATATGGLVGVVTGLLAESIGHCTFWMLPFTAGGFLYIALVTIVPELLEDNTHTFKQIGTVFLGMLAMATVTVIEKKSCSVMPGVR